MGLARIRSLIAVAFTLPIVIGVVILAQSSVAHTALVSSTPVAGSTLREFPREIELEFNEPLLTLGENQSNFFELFSPLGENIEVGEFSIDRSILSASIRAVPEISGNYEISYRVVASDGHVIRGSINFQYESEESVTTKEELEVAKEAKTGTSVPDGVLLGLILASSIIALLIYVKAGSEGQS